MENTPHKLRAALGGTEHCSSLAENSDLKTIDIPCVFPAKLLQTLFRASQVCHMDTSLSKYIPDTSGKPTNS